jgi:hypothetical protein
MNIKIYFGASVACSQVAMIDPLSTLSTEIEAVTVDVEEIVSSRKI